MKLLGHVVKSVFNLLRNCQVVFQSGCTIFTMHEGSNFSMSWATLIIVCRFDYSHSGGYIIVVLICISLGLLLVLSHSISFLDSQRNTVTSHLYSHSNRTGVSSHPFPWISLVLSPFRDNIHTWLST